MWEKISRKERSKRTDRLLDAVDNFLILTSGEFDTMKLYILELRTLRRMMLVAVEEPNNYSQIPSEAKPTLKFEENEAKTCGDASSLSD